MYILYKEPQVTITKSLLKNINYFYNFYKPLGKSANLIKTSLVQQTVKKFENWQLFKSISKDIKQLTEYLIKVFIRR